MRLNKFSFIGLICAVVLMSCQGTDKSGKQQQDSAAVGNQSDSLKEANASNQPKDVTNKSKVDGDGAAFMKAAALGGMMEVDLGKLATEKSNNPKVKAFAAKMVADHTMANQELKGIAQKLGVILPDAYPADMKDHMKMMKSLQGAAFDKHYIDMMVNDHDKTVNLFRSASSLRKEVKDFAAKTLPVIEGHAKDAKDIQAGLKP